MSELAVQHQCRVDSTCGTFICERCERCVPWCFGAADEYPEWCDDCCVTERKRLERLGLRLDGIYDAVDDLDRLERQHVSPDGALVANFDRALAIAGRLAALPDVTIAALAAELDQADPGELLPRLEARLAELTQSQAEARAR